MGRFCQVLQETVDFCSGVAEQDRKLKVAERVERISVHDAQPSKKVTVGTANPGCRPRHISAKEGQVRASYKVDKPDAFKTIVPWAYTYSELVP
ncbi:unnamed protein product [Fusarium venenatum]|uniref:Uncharacterized protein n=1 Tax=Fusarium venenatum TaxID=56646 RepID=A0A2L2TED2_9HYPO|nr:uncharacterized protein FVRRES_02905 [Fusarium venenatum]CEI66393.1 unnamed protein product [Fusarium venenatum]